MCDCAEEETVEAPHTFKKQNPIVRSRPVRRTDLPKLKQMVNAHTPTTFGFEEIDTIFHTSAAGVVALTATEEVVAAVFVNNYPNTPSIPPWDWMPWIRAKFNMTRASPANTLFINTALYDAAYVRSFLRPLLSRLFRTFFFCKFIVTVEPAHAGFLEWNAGLGTIVTGEGTAHYAEPPRLLVYLRQDFVAAYKLRMAVVEDNDDIVPLVDTQSKLLSETYGSFYLAEIIEEDKGRRVIVAEHDNKAVAVMIFNETLDYDLLNNSFQLECFDGLKKPSELDVKKRVVDLPESKIFEFNISDVPELSQKTSSLIMKESETKTVSTVLAAILEGSKDLNVHADRLLFSTASTIGLGTSSLIDEYRGDAARLAASFAGIADSRFSCHALNFSESQLEEFRILKKVMQLRRRTSTPSNSFAKVWTAVPVYKGEENAFVLEVVAAWDEHEESLLPLLMAGFELYPRKDYCVLCIPADVPTFPLISQIMVRVSPLPASNFPQELYVVHRNSIYGKITMDYPAKADLPRVEAMLKDLRHGPEIFKTFVTTCQSKYYSEQSFVVKCNSQVVGVVNMRDMTDLDYVSSRYQLEEVTDLSVHKPGCIGEILHFVLSPIFQKHSRFLLMELHRLSDYSLLFYELRPEGHIPGPYRKAALACVLNNLKPVLPARVPEYTQRPDDGWTIPDVAMKTEKPYAIYISAPMYCGLSRTEINSRIVVVGASDVGLSFLTHLIFEGAATHHIIFTNITLVSTHGMLTYKSNRFRDIMIPSTSKINSGYHLAMLSLSTFVNVVEGVMCAIDREKRAVSVNSSWLRYDALVLTCGTQYQMPARVAELRDCAVECPENVFVINTPEDVDVAMETLKAIALGITDWETRFPGYVIVYGNDVEAYCCVEALLNAKISELVFVESLSTRSSSAFEEAKIEKAIKQEMRIAGVTVFEKYRFYDWTFDDDERRVTTISFQGDQILNLPCIAAFVYTTKSISRMTFDAINNANLIYDGNLVIDGNFQTNDPNIYAAGKITKYPRRFYADHMKHLYFNQVEIGKRMARIILAKLLPFKAQEVVYPQPCELNLKGLVPRYYSPIYVHAKIPHTLEFLYVQKPGLPIPVDIGSLSDDFGQLLTTGSLKDLDRQGYFKLHLDEYNTVETILAVSKTAINTNNLICVWGKHESLLNNLEQRFEMATITDLFDFFSQPWTCALYHHKYDLLHRDLNELLTSLTDEPGTSVIEDVIAKIKANDYKKLTTAQHDEIMAKFKVSKYCSEMENRVVNFCTQNMTLLPMYLTPRLLDMTLGAYEDSPLFKKL